MVTLLARYLVEDNQEDFLIYDEERFNDVTIVKSVLKKLIGKYQLFEREELINIKFSISKKLTNSLIETISMISTKK